MKKVILEIGGIHCKSCEMIIEDALIGLGVEGMSFRGNKLKVLFDEKKLTFDQIKQAIRKEGYKVD